MIFKRKKPLPMWRRARDFVAPPTGWRRALEYFSYRLKRLPDTPHKIAIGVACGVLASFTPLFGLHFFYAFLCAWIVRGNMLAAALGTAFGNPITFPLIAASSLGMGRQIMGTAMEGDNMAGLREAFFGGMSGVWQSMLSLVGLADPAWDRVAVFVTDLLLPYYIGGLVPGLVSATAFYFLTRPLVAAYQARRRSKLLARAAERLHHVKDKRMAGKRPS